MPHQRAPTLRGRQVSGTLPFSESRIPEVRVYLRKPFVLLIRLGFGRSFSICLEGSFLVVLHVLSGLVLQYASKGLPSTIR